MGISSVPEPRDSLVWYLLYNAVASFTAVAGLLRAALVFLDLPAALPWGLGGDGDEAAGLVAAASSRPSSLADRFLKASRPGLYGVLASSATTCSDADADGDDCSVCLAGFVARSVVNRLPCGHLFHRACLETWLRYERATCPLCRANVPLPIEETPVLRHRA